MIRVRDRDQRSEVQHRVASAHRGAYSVRIAHVAGEDLEATTRVVRAAVEPSPRAERVVHHESPYVVSGAHERFREMGSDEAVGARDEHASTRGHAAAPAWPRDARKSASTVLAKAFQLKPSSILRRPIAP